MENGYFPHVLPNALPYNYAFAWVYSLDGIKTDPNFGGLWDKCKTTKRGHYQRPKLTAENDAWAHSSFMAQAQQYFKPTAPSVIKALDNAVGLDFLQIWLGNLEKNQHQEFRPVIYTTHKW